MKTETSQKIKISDDINVNEAGTYHINYSVTDSHGNTSTLEVPVTVEKDGTIFENGALTPVAKEKGAAVTFDSDVDWTTPGTYHVSVTFTIDKADPEVIPSGAFVVDNDNDHSNAGNTGEHQSGNNKSPATGAPFIGCIIASVLLMMAIIIIIKKERIRIKSC